MATIVIWFSCGAASAVAAKKTIEKYDHEYNIRVCNNPVKEEDDDNERFLKDVEKWIGKKIEKVTNPKYPDTSAKEVWQAKKYMSGNAGAPCTKELKKKARELWEKENAYDYLVLGFTADERSRIENFQKYERSNLIPILLDEGLTKKDCFRIIQEAGITLPRVYSYGFPNANCIGCVKAESPAYWNLVREKYPEVFWDRAKQSRQIGAKLVRLHPRLDTKSYYKNNEWWDERTGNCLSRDKNGKKVQPTIRIYLDELDPRIRKGKKGKLEIPESSCNSFCETDI